MAYFLLRAPECNLAVPKRTIMKTVLLLAILLWGAATNNTFANDSKVHPSVLRAFESNFGNRTGVKWSVVDNLYKAEFTIDDEAKAAFFSPEDGTMVAYSRYVTIGDLPYTLQRSLIQAVGSAAITEIFEVQSDTGTDYFASMQRAGETIVLKAASTKWMIYKKR